MSATCYPCLRSPEYCTSKSHVFHETQNRWASKPSCWKFRLSGTILGRLSQEQGQRGHAQCNLEHMCSQCQHVCMIFMKTQSQHACVTLVKTGPTCMCDTREDTGPTCIHDAGEDTGPTCMCGAGEDTGPTCMCGTGEDTRAATKSHCPNNTAPGNEQRGHALITSQ